MTLQGILAINLMTLELLIWILNLIRRARLYVGYGVMFILILLSIMAIVSIPGLLSVASQLVSVVFPSSATLLIALSFIAFLFIYILTQLTIISDRVATLVQELAIRNAKDGSERLAQNTSGNNHYF